VALSEENAERAARVFAATAHRGPNPRDVYEYNERIGRMQSVASDNLTGEQRRLFLLRHIQNRSIQSSSLPAPGQLRVGAREGQA
jgi:hypothetical protein